MLDRLQVGALIGRVMIACLFASYMPLSRLARDWHAAPWLAAQIAIKGKPKDAVGRFVLHPFCYRFQHVTTRFLWL
jgi:hypothetical protein